MARLDIARLILQATVVADRAAYVCKDPAFVKAAKEARVDIARAGGSMSALLRETRFAWKRSDTRVPGGANI